MGTWRRTLAGIGAAGMLLAACGGDDDGGDDFADRSADQILEQAATDMQAASSLRIAGDVTSGGDEISLDMAVTRDADCEGTMGFAGGTAEIISVGGMAYMKPDAAFWEAFGGAQASMIMDIVGDSWAVMPGEDLGDFCDLDELLDDMGDDEETENAEVDGTEAVDGQDAVRVTTETDEGDPLTVWVAADSPHHVLRMEVTGGDEPGTITFSDFDEDFGIEAPPEDQVVDLEQLGG